MTRALFSLLFGVASCSVEGPKSLPQLQAGPGIKVDNSTQTISLDPAAVIPPPATCNTGEILQRASGGFICVGAAPDSSALGGNPASAFQTKAAADATYLRVTGKAADSFLLGGQPPSAYAPAAGPLLASAKVGSSTRSITVNGVLCDKTSPVPAAFSATDGATTANGYRAAKVLCEATAGCGPSPTAHMCTPDEMVRTSQLGITAIGQFWIASGASTDCTGWTSVLSTAVGSVWGWSNGAQGAASTAPCNGTNNIACCN